MTTQIPDSASTLGWDPGLIVVAALQALGPDATAEQLRARIAGLKGFAGVNGNYDFVSVPQRGLDESNVVVTRWNAAARAWQPVSRTHGYLPKP
jgi:branched-chain amino acid transport system substrate-binding protein